MTRAEAERLLDAVGLHRALGLELVTWGEGAVAFAFAPGPLAREASSGAVHGGALATALDTAACFAAIARVGADCTTIDLRVDYLRPGVDERFVVRGEVLRAGRTLARADAALETVDGRLVAAARGTFTW